jgi:hypothetical protein
MSTSTLELVELSPMPEIEIPCTVQDDIATWVMRTVPTECCGKNFSFLCQYHYEMVIKFWNNPNIPGFLCYECFVQNNVGRSYSEFVLSLERI